MLHITQHAPHHLAHAHNRPVSPLLLSLRPQHSLVSSLQRLPSPTHPSFQLQLIVNYLFLAFSMLFCSPTQCPPPPPLPDPIICLLPCTSDSLFLSPSANKKHCAEGVRGKQGKNRAVHQPIGIPPSDRRNPWHRHPDKRLGLVMPTSVLAACHQQPPEKPFGGTNLQPARSWAMLCTSRPTSSRGKPPGNSRLVRASQLVSAGTQPLRGTNLQPARACSAPEQIHPPYVQADRERKRKYMQPRHHPWRTRFNGQNLHACLCVGVNS